MIFANSSSLETLVRIRSSDTRLSSNQTNCRFSMVRPSSQEAIRYIGLLEQITRDVLCIGIGIPRELRDLRQRSSSLISAGFK